MRVAVVGSRTFNNEVMLCNELQKISSITEIVSGGAKGADSLAENYAEKNNIPKKLFLPNWKQHGKIAGVVRNWEIINYSDFILIFWDGKSKGSLDVINKCKMKNKKHLVIQFS